MGAGVGGGGGGEGGGGNESPGLPPIRGVCIIIRVACYYILDQTSLSSERKRDP